MIDCCSPTDFQILQTAMADANKICFDLVGALPHELAMRIFSFLQVKEVCICRQVSKLWYERSKDTTIWRKMCEICFGSEFRLQSLSLPDWEGFYQALFQREKNWRNGNYKMKELLGHRSKVVLKVKEHILVSGSYDRCLKVWNLMAGECQLSISNIHSVSCIDFLVSEKVIATGSYNREAKIWNMDDGACLAVLGGGHMNAIISIYLSEEYLTTASICHGIVVWDWRKEVALWTVQHQQGLCAGQSIQFLPCMKQIVSCSMDGFVHFWESEGLGHIGSFSLHLDHPIVRVFIQYPFLTLTDASCHIYYYQLEELQACLLQKKNAKKFIDCISMYGKRIAASTPEAIFLWDVTGKETKWNVIWDEGANSLQLNENYLAMALGSGSIRVCNFLPENTFKK